MLLAVINLPLDGKLAVCRPSRMSMSMLPLAGKPVYRIAGEGRFNPDGVERHELGGWLGL